MGLLDLLRGAPDRADAGPAPDPVKSLEEHMRLIHQLLRELVHETRTTHHYLHQMAEREKATLRGR